ncbi:MAG TPA: HAD hydrolase-like protein [Terracidiphilus sp.]|jgi:phosphoglycolate phosphatase
MSDHAPVLIFDLDGTLTDSKAGILGCLRKVLDARGLPTSGSFEHFIGPPVEEWVTYLLPNGTKDEHAALASEYRACYDREGWSNNAVFPGIREMLANLRRAGSPLYVCTSKQERFAVRILDAFELSPCFLAIYGDRAEYASHSKIDLLARIVREQSLACESAWMVGDRSFDFEAAHANNLRCIAAGWGYGSPEERAQADALAQTPADVFAVMTQQMGGAGVSMPSTFSV